MRRAISYLRFSSPEQSKGDSYRRQTESTVKFCKENDLVLSEQLEDLGISAWKGKNLDDENALGGFLNMVKAGKIPKGTVLICENLDRLTRGKILKAVSLFTSILESGIDIVTTMDKKWYSEKSVSDNPVDLMISIIYLTRGNNESEVKSERVKSSWLKRYDNIKNGQFAKFRCPAWIQIKGNKYELIKENAATVKFIFDLYNKGFGVLSVVKELKKRGFKPFKLSKTWKFTFVDNLLQNPAVIGTCENVTPAVLGYYPRVISDEVFYKAIAQRQVNSSHKGNTGKQEINIFGGVCKCHKCDANMVRYRSTSKVGKQYNYLVCSQSKEGECDYECTDFNKFSDSFLAVLCTNNFKQFLSPIKKTVDNTEAIKGNIIELEKTIARVAKSIVMTESKALELELKRLEQSKKQLESDYESAKVTVMAQTDSQDDYKEIITHLNKGLSDNVYRSNLRNFIRKTVKEIIVKSNGYRVNFKNHREHITIVFEKDTFEVICTGERETFDYTSFK